MQYHFITLIHPINISHTSSTRSYQHFIGSIRAVPALHCPYSCCTSTSSPEFMQYHFISCIHTNITSSSSSKRTYQHFINRICAVPALHHPFSCCTSTSLPVFVLYHFITRMHTSSTSSDSSTRSYQHFIARIRAVPEYHLQQSCCTSTSLPVIMHYQYT